MALEGPGTHCSVVAYKLTGYARVFWVRVGCVMVCHVESLAFSVFAREKCVASMLFANSIS